MASSDSRDTRPPVLQPSGQPPQQAAPLPAAVRRPREDVEKLRDDALGQRNAGAGARVSGYAPFGKEAAVAEGVWAAARWLLGERPGAPISDEVYDYPFVGRAVGREILRAQDCIERLAWPDIDEDFAAGVMRALEWATNEHIEQPPVQGRP